ncbi:hypothetical protein IEQ34_011136 [Dendrobium chrysotoxum]|uniref:Uncharacterized protein n=1 Tax=Dendrobium chrysotoxum TaxID=161865 RepID=A0AAV7GXT9_DENCH|nr:hypothetical protein IEQ34_011136 [Dendrobium chrysotoxum]
MAGKVRCIMEGKKVENNKVYNRNGGAQRNIKYPTKCRPKDISNTRLKDHREKRKSKKLKPIVNNTPTTVHFTSADIGTQSSFV